MSFNFNYRLFVTNKFSNEFLTSFWRNKLIVFKFLGIQTSLNK